MGGKKAAKVKMMAKTEKLRTKESMLKKKRLLEDPANKRLRHQQRQASRQGRMTTTHLTRVTRRMNRAAKYHVRTMRRHVVDQIDAQEALASKVVKQYAKKLGIKTRPTVHFDLPDLKRIKASASKKTAKKSADSDRIQDGEQNQDSSQDGERN